jgi:hypothetical protein
MGMYVDRKRSVAIAALCAMAAAAAGQSFEVGTNAINLGLGVGGYGYSYVGRGYGSYTASPSVSLSYEHGITELGPGVLGIGGYLARKSVHLERSYITGTYSYFEDKRWTNTLLGVRCSWHYNSWHGNRQFDLYGGLMLGVNMVGYRNRSTRTSSNGAVETWDDGQRYSSGVAAFSLFCGARYYFTEAIGAFAELGYGIAWLNVGAAFRF